MNNIFKYLLVIYCLLGNSFFLNAQWIPTNGPEGGYITSFASTDSMIFVGTDGGGIYISKDGGSSWVPSNKGLSNLTIHALLASGKNLFAGIGVSPSRGGGIYLSTNNGTSWTPVNNGIPDVPADISYLTEFNRKLYVSTQGQGVYVSSNNGLSWEPDTAGLTGMYIQTLAVKDTSIFAGSLWGVYRSTISDPTWKRSADIRDIWVNSIVVNDSNLFASGTRAVFDAEIFRSTDNGSSWLPANSGLGSSYIRAMAVLDSELFAGDNEGVIYKSTNDGLNWTEVDTLVGAIRNLTVIDSNLFAGTDGGGVFLSTNKGESWTAVNTGLKNSKVTAVAVKDSIILAGTISVGIFRSTDRGDNWSQVYMGLNKYYVLGFAVSDSNIYAGILNGGIFKSTNEGMSWSNVGSNITGLSRTTTLAVIDTVLFAGTYGPGVYRSYDYGATWTAVNNGLTDTNVVTLAASDSYLFAGTSNGVFLSTNYGKSWVRRGLTGYYISPLAVYGKFIFAITTKVFETNGESGVFVSTNYGESWTKIDLGTYWWSIFSLACDNSNLYAGSSYGVLYQPISKITSVRFQDNISLQTFNLSQNYPNPFNPTTNIKYSIASRQFVELKVFNVLGQEIETLVNAEKPAGNYHVEFSAKGGSAYGGNAANLPSGVYFYRIQAGSFNQVRKMLLIK